MKQSIVAFTGISGVGKTTYLRKLQRHIPFQHLTGGSLISKARENSVDDRDSLRKSDLDENQRLLVQGFKQERDPDAGLVFMDGHVIVDSADGIKELPATVFEQIGVTMMVHLEADPAMISNNRVSDADRNRPLYSTEILAKHQERSRKHAMQIANEIGVEYVDVFHGDETLLVNKLHTLLQE